jgi:DNA-binding NarL/FixJ family response regulator
VLSLQATDHGRNDKKGLVPEPTNLRQHVVVLCGDLLLHRKLFRDSSSRAARLTPIRCSENQEEAFSLCRQLSVSVFVARQTFIEQLSSADFAQLRNNGKGSCVLAVLEGDCLAASATKMLRLGCRGTLPPRFSPKLLRRAALGVLRGELWASRSVVSELLSDLLRATNLREANGLTPQEARILDLTVQGYKNSAIAEALFISPETVRWHKRRLNRKIGRPHQARYPQAKAARRDPETAAG